MKNIKDIKQGYYIDESNIDGLDEKKSINSNGIGNNVLITVKYSVPTETIIP